jgi:hypothetical protein
MSSRQARPDAGEHAHPRPRRHRVYGLRPERDPSRINHRSLCRSYAWPRAPRRGAAPPWPHVGSGQPGALSHVAAHASVPANQSAAAPSARRTSPLGCHDATPVATLGQRRPAVATLGQRATRLLIRPRHASRDRFPMQDPRLDHDHPSGARNTVESSGTRRSSCWPASALRQQARSRAPSRMTPWQRPTTFVMRGLLCHETSTNTRALTLHGRRHPGRGIGAQTTLATSRIGFDGVGMSRDGATVVVSRFESCCKAPLLQLARPAACSRVSHRNRSTPIVGNNARVWSFRTSRSVVLTKRERRPGDR